MAEARIKVKRTDTESNRANSSVNLEYGQPLYVKDSNHLYVGDGTTQAKNLKYINQKEIEDINNTIGSVTQGKTVVEMISDAQTAAAQDATTKVNSLANGQVTTNKNDIANIKNTLLPNETSDREQADLALGTRIDNETSARQDADSALSTRIDTKLDKKTGDANSNKVYVNDNKGNPAMIKFNEDSEATTIVQRTSAGNINAAAATADENCMIKGQFKVTTEAAYNELSSKDPNTFYFITNMA